MGSSSTLQFRFLKRTLASVQQLLTLLNHIHECNEENNQVNVLYGLQQPHN